MSDNTIVRLHEDGGPACMLCGEKIDEGDIRRAEVRVALSVPDVSLKCSDNVVIKLINEIFNTCICKRCYQTHRDEIDELCSKCGKCNGSCSTTDKADEMMWT